MNMPSYERGRNLVFFIVALKIFNAASNLISNFNIVALVSAAISVGLALLLYKGNELVILLNKVFLILSVVGIVITVIFSFGIALIFNIISIATTLFIVYCLFFSPDVQYFFEKQREL